jgi:hypothetical protein
MLMFRMHEALRPWPLCLHSLVICPGNSTLETNVVWIGGWLKWFRIVSCGTKLPHFESVTHLTVSVLFWTVYKAEPSGHSYPLCILYWYSTTWHLTQ